MKNLARDMAISHIYKNYYGVLKRFLLVNLHSREDAEDLLQETFVRFQKYQAAIDLNRPKNFLFTIARNLMIDKFRHEKVAAIVDTEQEIDELMDPQSSVERQVLARQEFEVLCEAVNNLPPQCRRVFVLRKFHHLSHREIAEKLKLSVSTVEKHLAAGLAKCQTYIHT
ncbi:RNA polymerase sigma factor [Sedimenticola sp.]|uniref:RNA polymerase sigma factor n=1 Tax=Sedimenticola sp. TaxID=1940285 RepID=UPI003D0E6233